MYEDIETKAASLQSNNLMVTLSLVEILVNHRHGAMVGKGKHLVEVCRCICTFSAALMLN